MQFEIYTKRGDWIYFSLFGEEATEKGKARTGDLTFPHISAGSGVRYVTDYFALNVGFRDDRQSDPEFTGRRSVRKALVNFMVDLAESDNPLGEECRLVLAKAMQDDWSTQIPYLLREDPHLVGRKWEAY